MSSSSPADFVGKSMCPVCHKPVNAKSLEGNGAVLYFPFCSNRCKLIDLGAWLDEGYKIVSESDQQASDTTSESSGKT